MIKKNTSLIKIGIDLDNTVISYDRAFQKAAITFGFVEENCTLLKKALRDKIRKKPDGERKWQELQGFVYGAGINEAVLFPGVYRFLWRCREKNIQVEIVSHKTEFGHFDKEKISLHDSATKFLTNHSLLDNNNPLIKKVTYKSTRLEKLEYVKLQNYEWFIDDLEEIIFSKELKNQKGIMFSSDNVSKTNSIKFVKSSWESISQSILGNWSISEVMNMANKIGNQSEVENIVKLKGRGNSAIYKLHFFDGSKAALKMYPEITYHDRLRSEFESTKIFRELKINNVQIPISFDIDLSVATYEWIEGTSVSNYGVNELKAALSFLNDINQNSTADQFKFFPMAADACPKGLDIENQIKRRLLQFDNATKNYIELERFLKDDFEPLMSEIISWSQAIWPSSCGYKKPIDKSELILSPSDFGFHNAIYSQKKSLIFHDFEYFGWDDPVKLISDFSHHAAMDLSEELEQLWFSGASEIYGENLLGRLRAAWPLYGLNWCLIILNEFKDELWNRRIIADDSKALLRDEYLSTQLAKSKNKLNALALIYKNKFFW